VRRWLVILFVSLPAQAFWATALGGIGGAWAGTQLSQLITQAQAASSVMTIVPTAVAMPVAPAYASDLLSATPTPTRTPVPTQTPRPLPAGPQPDRYPAVSPFVFARR
jgi:hypothetical protein